MACISWFIGLYGHNSSSKYFDIIDSNLVQSNLSVMQQLMFCFVVITNLAVTDQDTIH